MESTFRTLVLVLVGVLVIVACAGSNDAAHAEPITVRIAVDSEWSAPPGFSITLPFTYRRIAEILKSDPGGIPDLPTLSMSKDIESGEEQASEFIGIYADGVSEEIQPEVVLASWFKSFRGGDFSTPIVQVRNGLQIAWSQGQGQGPADTSPRRIILTGNRRASNPTGMEADVLILFGFDES